MSYTKQTWASGDVITAAKMNHIEDGIANGGGGGTDSLIIKATEVLEETESYVAFETGTSFAEFDAALSLSTFRPVYALFPSSVPEKVRYVMLVKSFDYSETDVDGFQFAVEANPTGVLLMIYYPQ